MSRYSVLSGFTERRLRVSHKYTESRVAESGKTSDGISATKKKCKVEYHLHTNEI